jgi:hypothetical protein
MALATFDELVKSCSYWDKKSRVQKTRDWRNGLGPIYDMYLTPYTGYDPIKDQPINKYSVGKYGDGDAHSALISRSWDKRNTSADAYGKAHDHIENIRKLRRLLHTRYFTAIEESGKSKWQFRIKELLRGILLQHEAFKYHLEATREDINVELVSLVDEVGVYMRPGEGANFTFRMLPSYIMNVHHNKIACPNNSLTLHAEHINTTNWKEQKCKLDNFHAVWVESHIARYSAAFHVTVFGLLTKATFDDGSQLVAHGRSIKGIQRKLEEQITKLNLLSNRQSTT